MEIEKVSDKRILYLVTFAKILTLKLVIMRFHEKKKR